MRHKKKINLERLRQWLAWLLRKLCPRVTGARKESKMVGYLHVFLFSSRWSQIFLVLLTYLILFIVFEQLRRQARLRREYLYRKSVEEKERSTYERKKKLKTALEGQFYNMSCKVQLSFTQRQIQLTDFQFYHYLFLVASIIKWYIIRFHNFWKWHKHLGKFDVCN